MSFDWHRAFGLLLTDLFTNTPFDVEINKDISVKEQLLDVVVVRRRPGTMTDPLPDGFDPLAEHNLITFKSFHEPLDPWALDELLGYYVGYRKTVSPTKVLIAEERFRLYAVATRYPEKLARQFELKPVRDGVYDCQWGSRTVRLLVVKELPRIDPNAGLALLSADPVCVAFGRGHYRQKTPEMSSFLRQLLLAYREEIDVSQSLKEFVEQAEREYLSGLTAEDLARLLTPEKRLEGIPVEKRLEGIPVEERLEGIPPEVIERYLASIRSRDSNPGGS